MSKLFVALALGATASLAAARWGLTTVTVVGQSMWPSMGDRDVWLAQRRGRARRGRIALMREPSQLVGGSGHMVKRLLAVNLGDTETIALIDDRVITLPARSVWAVGDNRANSLDSRDLGPLPLEDVVAFPLWRLSKGRSTMDPWTKRARIVATSGAANESREPTA